MFDANPFCYGSIAAAISVAEHLKKTKKILLAINSSLELAHHHFDQVMICDVKSQEDVKRCLNMLGNIDLYVSISNNTNMNLVKELGIPIVFVDILFWLKNEIPDVLRYAQHYCVEDFPGVRESAQKFSSCFTNLSVVGPLISPVKKWSRRKGKLLVNYGGSESPLIKPGFNTDYPLHLTKLILKKLSDHKYRFSEVIIATGEKAAKSIQSSIQDFPSNVSVQTLEHHSFLHCLSDSELFITAPGLNAPLEAFYSGVPTFYLPPQNFTQIFQLNIYREYGLCTERSINLTDFGRNIIVNKFGNEKEETKKVLDLLKELFSANDFNQEVEKCLTRYFSYVEDPHYVECLLQKQEQFINKLGPAGSNEVARIIQSYL